MMFQSVTFTLNTMGVISEKWLMMSARQMGHCASATARERHESSRHTRLHINQHTRKGGISHNRKRFLVQEV